MEYAKRYPMIAKRQLILIKEAQGLEKKFDELSEYVLKPQKQSVVVFCYKNKSFDKRNKLYKATLKSGIVFESKSLYDNQVINWISNKLNLEKMQFEPKAVQILAEYLGSDLGRISQEIKKLKIINSDIITPLIIEQYIGYSKDFNNFELINAIGEKNIDSSYRIALYMSRNSNQHPLVVTISSIFNFFNRLLKYHVLKDKSKTATILGINPYFIKDFEIASKNYSIKNCSDCIDLLAKADLKSKGIIGVNNNHKAILIDLLNGIYNN
ncbi:MAG: DNA polymerase III subunit delta [Flavobacteriaceae bacterium]|nr:DNA polymerase III subunit delta [Flavobacteriaceae bacterium]